MKLLEETQLMKIIYNNYNIWQGNCTVQWSEALAGLADNYTATCRSGEQRNCGYIDINSSSAEESRAEIGCSVCVWECVL